MMYPYSLYLLLSALVTAAHAVIMVQLLNGSFVPMSFERRAPGDGLPLLLTNHNDQSYLTTVLMGTPYQSVEMAPSLSQNFISVATAPNGVSDSAYYSPTRSNTSTPLNEVASIPSISGETLQGRFVAENCSLKALNSADFSYRAAVALTAFSVADSLYPPGAKGCLGYGAHAPASSPVNSSLIPTFLTTLPPNFPSAVCGIELNHMDDPYPDGIFTMGAVDRAAFNGEFTNALVPASSTTSWSVPFDTISFASGGSNQSLPGLLASVDIYHSVIQVPTEMATTIYSGVPGSQFLSSGVWSVPCTSSFPITLTFSGKPFTISSRDTITKLANGSCRGAVTGGAQGIAKVGSPFLRNFYTQFGAERASNGSLSFFVGFAAKNVRSRPITVTTTLVNPTTVTAGAGPTSTSDATWIDPQHATFFSTLAIASIFAIIL